MMPAWDRRMSEVEKRGWFRAGSVLGSLHHQPTVCASQNGKVRKTRESFIYEAVIDVRFPINTAGKAKK